MKESNKDSIIKFCPLPITIEKNKIITSQMEECICKIKISNKEGIGFFCKIPHKNQIIYTLITNNGILNESTIKEHKNLNVTLNDEKEIKNIEINENNNIYTNNEYNITIIEINPKNSNINHFLELDEIIFNDNLNFFNEGIYILHYPKYNNYTIASVSYGIFEKRNNLNLYFFCNIGTNSIGSPILNFANNKLIGIYKENKELNYNTGIILKNIIEDFLKNIKRVTPNYNNLNKNHNNVLPNIMETNLGPETGEDEEDSIEIINKYKNIKESVDIKQTILGPEDFDDEEEETNDQNLNAKSNSLSDKNNINNNNLNINNYNETKEKFNNNNNFNNTFNPNSYDDQKKSKIKKFEDTLNSLNINQELNKKSSNSDHNNIKIDENINYFSNKQLPRMKLNEEPKIEENERYISSNQIDGINLNNNNINNNINNNTNNNINNNMNASMNFGNNQINSMDKMNLNNNKKDLSISHFNLANNLNNDNNSEKNLINKSSFVPKFSFSMYKNVSKTGLKDLGNTSYLNSTLQLLGCDQRLASFFLNPSNAINATISLSFFIQRLYIHFYPYPENDMIEIYEPKNILGFLNKFGKIDNPNNLIKIILDTLHSELNIYNKNIIKKNPNKFNKKELIKDEIINFQNFNNSTIFNIFNWFELKESQCGICNKTSYEFNTHNILDLNIWKSYNFYKKNCIRIYDCLSFYQLPKQEQYYCESCRNYKNKLNLSKIYSSPNVFIFSLDRGNMDQNLLNVRFLVEEKINLMEFIENKAGPSFYELNGIVSIYMNQKRYVSCCKSPVDQQWYYYDNEIVQKVDFNVVINNHNNNNFLHVY